MPFQPNFKITAKIADALMRIEGAKQAIVHLPVTALFPPPAFRRLGARAQAQDQAGL